MRLYKFHLIYTNLHLVWACLDAFVLKFELVKSLYNNILLEYRVVLAVFCSPEEKNKTGKANE